MPLHKIAIGTSVIVFFQFFGGAVFLAIAENLFQSRLEQELALVPSENAQLIVQVGAAAVRQVVKPENLQVVLEAYNGAIITTFVGLCLLISLVVETVLIQSISTLPRRAVVSDFLPPWVWSGSA